MGRLLVKATGADESDEAAGIRSFRLAHAKGRELPPFKGGAHIDLHLENGEKRQYSLASDPADRSSYRIGVLRQEGGRGGSLWVHDHLVPGSTVRIRPSQMSA